MFFWLTAIIALIVDTVKVDAGSIVTKITMTVKSRYYAAVIISLLELIESDWMDGGIFGSRNAYFRRGDRW